jgi:Phage integrase, N-terminal SAM-like domain
MESKPKLLDQARLVLRLKHMSYRTEIAYLSWIKRFILFHHKRHPKDMGAPEIRAFLAHLALHEQVAASTQNGALNALLFLYRHVLKQENRKFKQPFPPPACASPVAPSRPPAGARAPGSPSPAAPALSGFALRTCLGLGERLQALRRELGELGERGEESLLSVRHQAAVCLMESQ